jgi:RHH-type proline utilization regulon transcriptional repressor/proline dehydrogenase/delta 1-pyrroline-5-carboxylate dehydrogenase
MSAVQVEIEPATQEIGRAILREARDARAGVFSSQFWADRFMNAAMKDAAFKVQLFRFVDAFPTLNTPALIHDYLLEYLTQPGVTLPPGLELGLHAGRLAKGLLAKTIGHWISTVAGNFIAGADATAAAPKLQQLWRHGVSFSVDLLGEACVSGKEAAEYQRLYIDVIRLLAEQVRQWPANAILDVDYLGVVPRVNLSIKISALDARVDPIDCDGSVQRLVQSLAPLLQAAGRQGVAVTFDMEQYALKDLTLQLFQQCCQQFDFVAGVAMQAYLRSGEDDARQMIAWARRTGRQVTVRLIKGAYWDYEVIHAEQMGWPVPVWTRKSQTDACFERMAEMFLAATPRASGEGGVKLAVGSHNIRSIARALALLQAYDLPTSAVEFQMLYGMAMQLKPALLARGLRLREYVPVGEMIPGMAYLVRRLLENTSNESWLRAGFFDNASDESLLASPHEPAAATDATANAKSGRGDQFANEPWRDFSRPDVRRHFHEAVQLAAPPIVACDATVEDARQAVRRASEGLARWRNVDWRRRATVIGDAGRLMRDRRDDLAGIMICETGKTWREADADVCEAIDFCGYYAGQAAWLFEPQRLGNFVGELNETWHQPRGVAAIISPWNFPLAICTGMTTAALVTGNAAIVKPSGQSAGIAQVMCEILWQAGVPRDALLFLPGRGSTVGAALVRDPNVAIIAFTGSKEVGLDIFRAAGQLADGQTILKKVVCEMGGKNAIIIDESADLDEAVLAARHSAFSYSGQKCSACSRVIVVEAVYKNFLDRLIEATRSLAIGDPLDPATDIGPVIDAAAARRILEYIEIGRREAKLELACQVPAGLEEQTGRCYVGPHIFSAVAPQHRLASEEIFGPVLSVMRAADFAEALRIANSTAYKLTGGVFSRRPSHLDMARREFRVGNLYLNRGITGALVGRQPFGGFGLSGGGTKAGGGDYLLNFVEPACCCENTMRRGFAPGLP